MYECTLCGNFSVVDYKCCDLCGNDEWIKEDTGKESESIVIKFANGSKIKTAPSKNNIRGRMSQYFTQINEYLNSLSDKEFDELLIECGIENCPYEAKE